MEKIKAFFAAHKFFRILKWVFLIIIAVYFILVGIRVVQLFNQDKINAEVERIHNTKLTLDDVMGKNLPPDPGALADATIQGVDANNNGIRDDVELAVFKAYPNSAKTRAVLLQYALVLQMQMTLPIITTETVTATVEDNESRAQVCLWNLSSRSDMDKFLADMKKYEDFIKELQLNNTQRKDHLISIYKYIRSFSMSNDGCDLDISNLPN